MSNEWKGEMRCRLEVMREADQNAGQNDTPTRNVNSDGNESPCKCSTIGQCQKSEETKTSQDNITPDEWKRELESQPSKERNGSPIKNINTDRKEISPVVHKISSDMLLGPEEKQEIKECKGKKPGEEMSLRCQRWSSASRGYPSRNSKTIDNARKPSESVRQSSLVSRKARPSIHETPQRVPTTSVRGRKEVKQPFRRGSKYGQETVEEPQRRISKNKGDTTRNETAENKTDNDEKTDMEIRESVFRKTSGDVKEKLREVSSSESRESLRSKASNDITPEVKRTALNEYRRTIDDQNKKYSLKSQSISQIPSRDIIQHRSSLGSEIVKGGREEDGYNSEAKSGRVSGKVNDRLGSGFEKNKTSVVGGDETNNRRSTIERDKRDSRRSRMDRLGSKESRDRIKSFERKGKYSPGNEKLRNINFREATDKYKSKTDTIDNTRRDSRARKSYMDRKCNWNRGINFQCNTTSLSTCNIGQQVCKNLDNRKSEDDKSNVSPCPIKCCPTYKSKDDKSNVSPCPTKCCPTNKSKDDKRNVSPCPTECCPTNKYEDDKSNVSPCPSKCCPTNKSEDDISNVSPCPPECCPTNISEDDKRNVSSCPTECCPTNISENNKSIVSLCSTELCPTKSSEGGKGIDSEIPIECRTANTPEDDKNVVSVCLTECKGTNTSKYRVTSGTCKRKRCKSATRKQTKAIKRRSKVTKATKKSEQKVYECQKLAPPCKPTPCKPKVIRKPRKRPVKCAGGCTGENEERTKPFARKRKKRKKTRGSRPNRRSSVPKKTTSPCLKFCENKDKKESEEEKVKEKEVKYEDKDEHSEKRREKKKKKDCWAKLCSCCKRQDHSEEREEKKSKDQKKRREAHPRETSRPKSAPGTSPASTRQSEPRPRKGSKPNSKTKSRSGSRGSRPKSRRKSRLAERRDWVPYGYPQTCHPNQPPQSRCRSRC